MRTMIATFKGCSIGQVSSILALVRTEGMIRHPKGKLLHLEGGLWGTNLTFARVDGNITQEAPGIFSVPIALVTETSAANDSKGVGREEFKVPSELLVKLYDIAYGDDPESDE